MEYLTTHEQFIIIQCKKCTENKSLRKCLCIYFFQKTLFIILVPLLVRNVVVLPDARNITVIWTKPSNVFGDLKYYLVIFFFFSFFFDNIDSTKNLCSRLFLLQTMCTISIQANTMFISGFCVVIENQRRLQNSVKI